MNVTLKTLFLLFTSILCTQASHATNIDFTGNSPFFSLENTLTKEIKKANHHTTSSNYQVVHNSTLGSIILGYRPFNTNYKQSKFTDIEVSKVAIFIFGLLFAPVILLLIYIKRFFQTLLVTSPTPYLVTNEYKKAADNM